MLMVSHAPGIRDKNMAVIVGHHVLLAHGLSVPRLRKHISSQAQVGIAIDFYPVYAADDRPETLLAIKRADTFRNLWFLDPIFRGHYPEDLFTDLKVDPPPVLEDDFSIISVPIDFLGVNYYSRMIVRDRENGKTTPGQTGHDESYEAVERIPGASYTEMGWEVFPEGLANILTRIHREYAPKAVVQLKAALPSMINGMAMVPFTTSSELISCHAYSNRCTGHSSGCAYQGLLCLVVPG